MIIFILIKIIHMEYEKRHYACAQKKSTYSVPAYRVINELKERILDYTGTFSEYNPIGYRDKMAVVVKKNIGSHYHQRDFKLKGFKLRMGTGYHSQKFNTNYGIKFTKQDLLRIANEMQTDDELHIMTPDSIDVGFFEAQIKKVTE